MNSENLVERNKIEKTRATKGIQRKEKVNKCYKLTNDCGKGSEYCVAVDYCCCILQNV